MGHARARRIPAQLLEDEDYQLRYERVAGIDVAKAEAEPRGGRFALTATGDRAARSRPRLAHLSGFSETGVLQLGDQELDAIGFAARA